MAIQTGTPCSGFFYCQAVGSSNAGAPAAALANNRPRFAPKLLLAVLSSGFALGLLTGCGSADVTTTTPAIRPVVGREKLVRILDEPRPRARAIAWLSNADLSTNVSRLNDQWSRVALADGREGFVSNQFLANVPDASSAPNALASASSDTAYSSPTTYAASAAAYGYATWSAARRERRFRRSAMGRRLSRPAPSYRAAAPVAPLSRPAKAPTYSATYSTKNSSSRTSDNGSASFHTTSNASNPSSSYRTGSSASSSYRASSSSSYRPTYSAPRVNYTFRSSSRSMKRRR